MQPLFLFLFTLVICSTNAQFADLIVKDRETDNAIPYVSFYDEAKQEGTISNLEGKVKLPLSADKLTVTHLGYKRVYLNLQDYRDKTTVYLIPQPVDLSGVTVSVYDIDLKKIFRKFLRNHDKIYLSGGLTYETTYKETYKVNGNLARLSQYRMNFWHKDYVLNFRKSFEKQYQIEIGSVDYSKIKDEKLVFGGTVKLSDIFKSIHLNFHLLIALNWVADITIDAVTKTENSTTIMFSSPVVENNNEIGQFNGVILFNPELSKILETSHTFTSSENYVIKDFTRKDSIPFSFTNQIVYRHITFIEQEGKLRLSRFEHKALGNMKYENDSTIYSVESSVNMFITKVKKGKDIAESNAVDISKPLHENLPKLKKSDPKILLTKEELDFINDGR